MPDTRHPTPDTHMFHIHNGDSSADTAKQTSLPGEHFAFREALITGPTPSDLTPSEWRQVRARHLSESYGVELEKCERELSDQEEKLATCLQHDEVVLWFEHDLFCQIHLIYLLNWFAQQHLNQTKLSLICTGTFPGKENFRGLGELNSDELASLFPKRQQVTPEQLKLATAAWQAFSSSAPTEIEKVLEAGTVALPYLDAALRAHLRRFPSTTSGLGAVERRGLELIHNGLTSFKHLFPRFGDAEPVYGLGDAQFWLTLKRMTEARQPLLTLNNGNGEQKLGANVNLEAVFEVTNLGEAVLKGNADFVELNGIDLWLGGVHLDGDATPWRWDDQLGRVVSDW
ncbi:MAG: RNA polymerase subunit sigma-24 [Acidobacteriota bacterium]